MERIKINSQCCFVGLKNNSLIYRCRECKQECKRPIEKLIKDCPSIYDFSNGDLNKFILKLGKGIYRYKDMNYQEKYNETTLPLKEDFYNKLNLESISNADYAHAEKVWKVFRIKNRGEYCNLYAQSDTLLLADVFENFRNMCFEEYRLEPAHFLIEAG